MRAVVSAGMVVGIQELGLLRAFDAVYGSSGGAINGAYLVAGQAPYGTTVFYNHINNRRFIDPTRLVRRRPIVDLGFLFDDVMTSRVPLDVEAVLTSPVPLKVLGSSVAKLKIEVFSDFRSREDLFGALRAGATIPFVAGPPREIGDDRYLDAAVMEPIPIHSAMADGCTHILALLTRPKNRLLRPPSYFDKLLVAPQLAQIREQLGEIYLARDRVYAESIQVIEEAHEREGQGPTPHMFGIRVPEGSPSVSRLERNRRALMEGAIRGTKALGEAFRGDDFTLVETFSLFDRAGKTPRSD